MSLSNLLRVSTGAFLDDVCFPPPGRPLRIAMMTETVALGGAEVVMLQLSEELRRRGHTVFPIGPVGREGWLRKRFQDLGFGWNTFSWKSAVDWGCVEGMATLMRDLKVDAAHGHEFTPCVYGVAATRLLGIPHVASMHGNQQMTALFRRRVALRWAFKRGESTVAVSQDTRRTLEASLGVPAGRITVVHNGIPERPGDGRAVRAGLGLEPGDLLVLAVGSLMLRKGHHVLLDAMRRVDARGGTPRFKLAIAGEGAERGNLERLIAEHGLASRAVLLGNRDDIPDLQAAADVFVMPSLWEGLPLAILEAMFARNPIIASTASGIPEALTDGTEGLLVPPGDADALATSLHRVLTDPALRSALGAAARTRAERQFSIGAMTDAYERLYHGGH